jgi:cytochrome c553
MKYVSLKLIILLMALAGVGLLWGERQTAASGQAAAAEKLFLETIQPWLATKCQGCHNDDLASAALNPQTRAGLLKGGRRGASIVAGKAINWRCSALNRRSTC